jgi:hypothetical protein
MSPESEHFDNAIKNGRIKLQYEDNDCICVICLYEYGTGLGLKKDTFRLLATCAGPKQLIKKQKTYNALVEENVNLKAQLAKYDLDTLEIAALKAK